MLTRQKMFKKRNLKLRARIKLLLVAVPLLLGIVAADNAIKNIVSPMAIKNAEMLINTQVNIAIGELLKNEGEDFNSYITPNFSTSSSIGSISSRALEINKFKAAAIVKIEDRLEEFSTIETPVQIGNIINSSLLSNRGPSLNILYDLCCSVNAEIKSEFSSAGVNQTLHTVKLVVTTDAYLSIFCDQTHTNVVTDYVLGESVIVGEAPKLYAN